MAKAAAPMTARPPTTPPTMAPIGVDLLLGVDVEELCEPPGAVTVGSAAGG